MNTTVGLLDAHEGLTHRHRIGNVAPKFERLSRDFRSSTLQWRKTVMS